MQFQTRFIGIPGIPHHMNSIAVDQLPGRLKVPLLGLFHTHDVDKLPVSFARFAPKEQTT